MFLEGLKAGVDDVFNSVFPGGVSDVFNSVFSINICLPKDSTKPQLLVE